MTRPGHDATFCPRDGAAAGLIVLEGSNYPGWFPPPSEPGVVVDQAKPGAAFLPGASSSCVRHWRK